MSHNHGLINLNMIIVMSLPRWPRDLHSSHQGDITWGYSDTQVGQVGALDMRMHQGDCLSMKQQRDWGTSA